MIKSPLLEKLYPTGQGLAHVTSPRRLPPFWLWTTRGLWVAIFLVMAGLNIAAIVALVQHNESGAGGGAAGLRAMAAVGGWSLVVDAKGPGAAAGIVTGDLLLAVDGEAIAPAATYRQVNGLLYGAIGEPLTVTVQSAVRGVQIVPLTLVSENVLQVWRRWRVPLGMNGPYLPALEAVLLAGYLLTSALIFWRRTDDWLALYLTLTLVLITPQLSYSWYYLGLTAPFWQTIFRVIIAAGITLTLPNFYLLPNGRFVPRLTIVLTAAWVAFSLLTELFRQSPQGFYQLPGARQLLVWLAWFATGMVAQAYRYRRRATATEQQQIKWVGFGLSVAVLVNLGWILAFELWPALNLPGATQEWMWLIGRTVYVLGMLLLPVAFGIAVFRYRLWDIDNLINRTLVYGGLTAIIVGIYIVVVSVLNVVFASNGHLLNQIIAIGLNLIIFDPLRDRLQTAVDRLMFGESADLGEVAARLGQRLAATPGPDAVLPVLVETIAAALKSPYVAISLPQARQAGGQSGAFAVAFAAGSPTAVLFTWPLVYCSKTVGQLLLGPRREGEPFKAHEWELVRHVAYQAGAAVHDVLLEEELARGDNASEFVMPRPKGGGPLGAISPS